MTELKVDSVYYDAWVDDDGKVIINTCILRTIRGKYGYLVVKNRWTWVKEGFGDRATWGWAKRIDEVYRTRFRLSEGLPEEYARSPSQAIRARLRKIKRLEAEFPETDPEMIEYDRISQIALNRRLKLEMSKKKKARVKPSVATLAA